MRKFLLFSVGLLQVLLLTDLHLFAEGTKEFMPDQNEDTRILIAHGNIIGQPRDPFALESNTIADSNYRLCIHISDWAHEKIYFGLGQNSASAVAWKIWLPDGSGTIYSGNTPATGNTGYIGSYLEATSGPSLLNASGYSALEAIPTMNGDYYMTFNVANSNTRNFLFFDITVVSNASGSDAAVLGRVFSKCWQFSNPQKGSTWNKFKGQMFIYSKDRVVTKLDPNALEGRDFSFSSNESGCYVITPTMTLQQARRSQTSLHKYPQYRVFLNDPDHAYYPDGVIGQLVPNSLVTTTQCNSGIVTFDFDTTPLNSSGTVQITLSLSTVLPTGTYADRVLSQTVTGGHTQMVWDGLDGNGVQVPSGSTFNFVMSYTMGLSHLPLWDVENNVNGFKVYLIRPQAVPPLPDPAFYWDDQLVTGGSQMVNPPGCLIPPATSCHEWSNIWGDQRTINTWWYVSSDFSTPVTLIYKKSVGALSTPSGPTSVCPGSTNTYTVTPDPNALSYTWTWDYGTQSTVPPSISISLLASTPAGTMTLSVQGHNNECPDGPASSLLITVKPVPDVVVSPVAPLTICNNTAAVINLSSSVPGTVGSTTFNWTATAADPLMVVPPTVTASTTTQISQVFNNLANITEDVSIFIGPSSNGCTGLPVAYLVVVNPTPSALFTSGGNPPNPQEICSSSPSLPVILSSNVTSPTPSYSWTVNCNPANISNCPANGSGTSIPSVTPVNLTGSAQNVVFSTAASLPGQGSQVCSGPSSDYTIQVNPKPALENPVLLQNVCSGLPSTLVNLIPFPDPPAVVTFNWVATPSSPLLTGFTPSANNTFVIPVQTITNPTGVTQYVDYTITPVFSGGTSCQGDLYTYRINVYQLPVPTISGPTSVCSGLTQTYSTEAGWNNYTWSVSAGGTITSGPGTNIITVQWNALGGQTVAVNYSMGTGCSSLSPTVINITVNPLPTPTISGPSTVCQNTQHDYSTQPGMSGYTWTVPPEGTIIGPANTSSIAVLWNSPGTHSIMVNYTNSNTCTAVSPASYPVTVNPAPVPVITGPAEACLNSTSTYSVQSGMSGYLWTVSAGGTITGSAGNNTVQVAWNTTGIKTLTVTYTDLNGCIPLNPTSKSVTINALPTPVISGPQQVCYSETSVSYSSPNVSGHTYTWIVVGAISYTGNPGNTITIDWGPGPSGTVQLTEIDQSLSTNCSTTTPIYNVIINPAPTPVITGPSTPCGQTTQTYTVGSTQANHAYLWTVTGGSPVIGSNSSISVTWGNTNPVTIDILESILYAPGVICSAHAPAFNVSLVLIPDAAGTITGPASSCQTLTKTYSVSSIANADSYTWWYNPLTGVTIVNNGTSADLTYGITSVSGNLFVQGNKTGCLPGPASPPLPITIYPQPYVNLISCNDIKTTTTSRPFTLKGGVPLNGTYFIDGNLAAGNLFNPAAMSTGTHQITYSVTDFNICTKISTPLSIIVYSGSILSSCPVIFTDVRNGKTYHASLLAGRCWMTENLVYGNVWPDNIPQTDNCSAEKYCLPSDATCSGYGGLYQWNELMQYQLPAAGQTVQGLCPPEWHVPTLTEWQTLIDGVTNPGNGIAGGTLKDLSLATGFKALLGGMYYMNNTWDFRATETPQATMFWTSTSQGVYRATARGLNNFNYSLSLYPSSRANAFPVRCVKD